MASRWCGCRAGVAVALGLGQLGLQFAVLRQHLLDRLGLPGELLLLLGDEGFQSGHALFTAHASMLHCPASPPDLLRVQTEEGAIYAKRSLLNGQTFIIVKVFYDLPIIENLLDALGFAVSIHKLDDIFFFLQARRKAQWER